MSKKNRLARQIGMTRKAFCEALENRCLLALPTITPPTPFDPNRPMNDGHLVLEDPAEYADPRLKVRYQFNQPVNITRDDLFLTNLTSAESIFGNQLILAPKPGNIFDFSFADSVNGFVGTQLSLPGILPNGHYEAVVNANGVTNSLGEHLDGNLTILGPDDHVSYFRFLMGDATHDGVVDVDDFGKIDHNASTGGVLPGWFNGDFDFSGTQDVDDAGIIDYVQPLFALMYGTRLPEPPSAPNTLTATAATGNKSITLTWQIPTGPFDGFGVWRSPDDVHFTLIKHLNNNDPALNTAGGLRSWADTDLDDGSKYTYRVRAYTTANGYSHTTNKASAVIPLPGPLTITPTAFTGDTLTLTWPDTTNRETAYELWQRTNGGAWAIVRTVPGQDGGTLSTTFANLDPLQNIEFAVAAKNAAAASAPSQPWWNVARGEPIFSTSPSIAAAFNRPDLEAAPPDSFLGNESVTATFPVPRHTSVRVLVEAYFGEVTTTGTIELEIDGQVVRSVTMPDLESPLSIDNYSHDSSMMTVTLRGTGFAGDPNDGLEYWTVAGLRVFAKIPYVSVQATSGTHETNPQPLQLIFARTIPTGVSEDFTMNVVVEGTATEGLDYQPIPRAVPFHATTVDERFHYASINVIDDTISEGPEELRIRLLPGERYALDWEGGYSAASSVATVTINDNEPYAYLETTASGSAIPENGPPASTAFRVRTANLSTASTVTLAIQPQSTASTADYAMSTTVTVPAPAPNVFGAYVPVTPFNDTLIEATETLIARVASLTIAGATVVIPNGAPATLKILDDDLQSSTAKDTVNLTITGDRTGLTNPDAKGTTDGGPGLTTGWLIPVNDDRDEQNADSSGGPRLDNEPDNTAGDRVVASDNELRFVTASISSDQTNRQGTYSLTFPPSIKVWKQTATGYEPVTSGQQGGTVTLPIDLNLAIEGVSPSAALDDAEIKLTFTPTSGNAVSDSIKLSKLKANLGFNNASDHPNDLRPETPDAEFAIDAADDRYEEEGNGLQWWWNKSSSAQSDITANDLEDLIPFEIDIPQWVADAEFIPTLKMTFSGLDDTAVWIYDSQATASDRTKFLSDLTTAGEQVSSSTSLLSKYRLTRTQSETSLLPLYQLPVHAGKNQLLMRISGSGTARITFSLLLASPNLTKQVTVDTAIITVEETDRFYTTVSSRNTPDTYFNYPTEDGRSEMILRYPYSMVSDRHDPTKKKTLIFIHGYNNDETSAHAMLGKVFKRTYWQGFRGNFVGFLWEGNEYHVGGPVTFFKPNQTNAFKAAPSFMTFLRSDLYTSATVGGWDVEPEDVDVMAHSLGNQIMWDAMRLNTFTTDGPLFNNAIAVQAAIWEEAFKPESAYTYNTPSDPITYTADELKQMSWYGWFNQVGHDPRQSLTGDVYHSWNIDDSALIQGMRASDWATKVGQDHYDRTLGTYRSPTNMAWLHALMGPDRRKLDSFGSYLADALTVPIGARTNPIADYNFDAATAGWRAGEHSDLKNLEYPRIYAWFKRFLANPLTSTGEPAVVGPTAIPVGKSS